MNKVDELLAYVNKTNPEMTRERLIEELKKSRYSSVGLLVVFENYKAKK